jgi:Holliday junction resolvase-like predicted endonuclease
MATGAKVQQTARAGEHYVAAELNRRGAYAVTFAGNMPKIDILASDVYQERTVQIQVKTRRVGTWHTSDDEGKKLKPRPNETNFWIFVDISKIDEPPEYYIVPDWWMRNSIKEACDAYFKKKKGKITTTSKHHGVDVKRIVKWKDRWDILKIF